MSQRRILALGAVTLSSILWGTTGTAATFAPAAGPLAIGAFALGIGGILQALVAIGPLRTERAKLGQRRGMVGVGAIAVAIYPLAFYSSMHLAGVALGAVVSLASAPLAAGIIERVVGRKPLSRWWIAAAGLGIAGSFTLCLARMADQPQAALPTLAGIGLGLIAGTTYAVYSWCAQNLMDSGVSRAASMGAIFGAGGLILLPVIFATGAQLISTPQTFAVASYMALIPMFLGYLLFGFGLAHLPVSTVTTLTLSEPAIATILAVVVVGERLNALGWSGLGAIGLALAMLAFTPTPRRSPTPQEHRRPSGSGADGYPVST